MDQNSIFRVNNRIIPEVILPSNNFFQGNNRQNTFLTQSCTDNFSIEKSDGTLYSLTTNGNSSANSKRKNGSYSGKKQLAIRQTNDESTQSVRRWS